MAKQLKKGDKVEWHTSQGKTTGTVKKKVTSPMKIKSHKVAASKSDPEYLVESSKSGDKAAHKAEALKKVSKSASTSKKTSKSGSGAKASKSTGTKKSAKSSTPKAAAGKSAKSGGGAKKHTTSSSKTKKSTSSKPGPKKKAVAARSKAKSTSSSGSSAGKRTAGVTAAKKSSARTASKQTKDDEKVIADFKKMMNIPPKELDRWLDTDESKKVGFKENGKGESVGHESGKKILRILAKRKDRYTDEDVKHIHKVVGYVKRHLAQKPKGDISASNWRYSLMNWGHDPAK